jgi:hypothetical protein
MHCFWNEVKYETLVKMVSWVGTGTDIHLWKCGAGDDILELKHCLHSFITHPLFD